MSAVKINARDLVVQVADATGAAWLDIGGLNSITVNPGENEETVETTTFDSQGNYEQEIMQRGASLSMEGFRLQDPDTGAGDVGQARCEELATKLAGESLGSIRFRQPADEKWTVWKATFSVGEQGGGNNDKTSWSCSCTRSGASTQADVTS